MEKKEAKVAAVTMKNITKKFGPVVASDKVNLDIYKGEILCTAWRKRQRKNNPYEYALRNLFSG